MAAVVSNKKVKKKMYINIGISIYINTVYMREREKENKQGKRDFNLS